MILGNNLAGCPSGHTFYGLDGGVHIMAINTGNEMKLVTTFLNENGADIPRDFERKIEILFMREDLRAVSPM